MGTKETLFWQLLEGLLRGELIFFLLTSEASGLKMAGLMLIVRVDTLDAG